MAFDVRELQVTVCSDRRLRVGQIPRRGVNFGNPELQLSELDQQTIEVLIEQLRQNRLTELKEFRVLGHHLYKVLFDNEIGKELTNFLLGGDGDQEYSYLRLMLAFEDGQKYLESWPWEYLFCPVLETFLSMRADVVLTRYIELTGTSRGRSLHVDKPYINILFVAASPEDLRPIHYFSVFSALQELEKEPNLKGRIAIKTLITDHEKFLNDQELQNSLGQATVDEFYEALRNIQPHVIHFIGHGQYVGNGGELAFVDASDKKAYWVPEDKFAAWLGPIHSLRLVFLQACETDASNTQQSPYVISGIAHCLAKLNIPAVIAMKYRVDNHSSNVFATYFYKALAEGKDVDAAVQKGREQILLKFNDDRSYSFGLPTLYLRSTGGLLAPIVPNLQEIKSRKKKKA